jgi:hypothetical protein
MKPQIPANRSVKYINVPLDALILMPNVRSERSLSNIEKITERLNVVGLIKAITVIAHQPRPANTHCFRENTGCMPPAKSAGKRLRPIYSMGKTRLRNLPLCQLLRLSSASTGDRFFPRS